MSATKATAHDSTQLLRRTHDRTSVLPPFDVVESRLRIPPVRAGSISRTALVNRLRSTRTAPIVIVSAPAGYGKTTMLAQWSARDHRQFAWISLDGRDDDPLVLLRYVAMAIDRVSPVPAATLESLRSPGSSLWSTAVPRVAAALAGIDRPFVLVLDGVDNVRSEESLEAIAVLGDQVRDGSVLALSGRSQPAIGVARLRAEGRVHEIGLEQLALTRREATMLVGSTGTEVTADELAELLDRTEGWAAGLYLGVASLGRGRTQRPWTVSGDDHDLADYFRSEHLTRVTPDLRTFMRRTSVLSRLSGALCDAVLQTSGSAARLDCMHRSNMFLVPLDEGGRWYRYHGLFRDLLRRELEDEEPGIVADLNRRAADWFEAHDDPESAFTPALAAGDIPRVARIVADAGPPLYRTGHADTVDDWLRRFPDDAPLHRYPETAALGGWVHVARGRRPEAERWLEAAERGTAGARQRRADREHRLKQAVLRAALCNEGADAMLADAETAVSGLHRDSRWHSLAMALRGAAHLLRGDPVADEALAEAAATARSTGAPEAAAIATGQRVFGAHARGDHAGAEQLAIAGREAAFQNGLGGYPTATLLLAASARSELRQGRWVTAHRDLDDATRLRSAVSPTMPWLAAQVQLELAAAHVALRDSTGARELTDQAGQTISDGPPLPVLEAQVQRLRDEVDGMDDQGDGNSSGLTAAELRLLPLLATHLTFREIGEQLFVSRNTIKTQAISVYRKLGVSSRSDAITRAGALGLVEVAAAGGQLVALPRR